MFDFKTNLTLMRSNFEQNRPQKIKLHRPWWMFADEELSKIYKEKETLIKNGTVYYSHLLQANTNLFNRFPPFDYPAQIIYSTDTDCDPAILGKTATEIYSYKYGKKSPPDELKEIVKNIRNERDRTAFSFTRNTDSKVVNLKMQTIMVYRKHIPNRFLQEHIIPIISSPNCDSVIILPKEYWTSEFINYWTEE